MNSFSKCSLHRMQSFRSGLLQCGSPKDHRSYHKTCQGPAPARALHELQPHLGHIPGPQHGVLHGWCVGICSDVVLHGLQRSNLCHHGLHGLHRNLYTSTWSIFSPSILTDPGACRAASHFLTPLSQLLPTFFYPSLNVYHRCAMNIADGLSFSQQ